MKAEKGEFIHTLKYAGAFIAWVIGSGFATGQEILQFFGSYGYMSFAIVVVNLAGFLIIGKIMMTKGFQFRETKNFNPYVYYCGKKIGKIYSILVPLTLIMVSSVLISAAGATLEQYYGFNRHLGSAIMAIAVLLSYLMGFEKLVKIVSPIGPIIIIFSVFVGVYTLVRDVGHFSEIRCYTETLEQFRAAPHWSISAVLYLSLNFLSGSTYYSALGASAESYRCAKWGAILGAAALVGTIAVMNFAIILNAGSIEALSVPTLYFATRISPVFGAVFFVVLILGIFASTSATVWSFCSGFFKNDQQKNRLFSFGTIVFCMIMGFVPFGKLMAIAYPIIGYIGLFYIVCVIVKGIKNID